MDLVALSADSWNRLIGEIATLRLRVPAASTETQMIECGRLIFQAYFKAYGPQVIGHDRNGVEAVVARVLDEMPQDELSSFVRHGIEIGITEALEELSHGNSNVMTNASGTPNERQPGATIAQEKTPGHPCAASPRQTMETELASLGQRSSGRTERGCERKGDITLLQRADGKFYDAVEFPRAEQYAGISSRRRQQLMKDGTLRVDGKGSNRRINVESLLQYCPPAEPTK